MDTVKIYGASDDLLEVDGAISEEFDANCEQAFSVATSNGVLLRVHYDDDGIWRIIVEQGAEYTSKWENPPNDDESYSDIVTIEAESIDWVVVGSVGRK